MFEASIFADRERRARETMRTALESQQAEDSVELFIQHHLQEIEASYWQKHFGTATPTAMQVLESPVLVQQWDEEDLEIHELYDFTLPEDVTNYLICVSFDSQGHVLGISMES